MSFKNLYSIHVLRQKIILMIDKKISREGGASWGNCLKLKVPYVFVVVCK